MRDGWVERDGLKLHWREWEPIGPELQPALFCIHGLSSNSMFWTRLAARFSDRRVVAYDQRAHGGSDRAESGYDFDELAADARFVLSALELERPVLLGHSWGASVALALAAADDTPVSALVHIDGPLQWFGGMMSWEQASVLMQPPLKRYPTLDEAVEEHRAYLKTGWGDDLVQFVAAGLIRDAEAFVLPMDAPTRLHILRELYELKPEELWPRVRVPLYLAVASQAPEFIQSWKRAGVDTVQRLAPAAEIKWYDSAHDIPLHLPDELAADIEDLIRRKF